jgi:hypothetical protein
MVSHTVVCTVSRAGEPYKKKGKFDGVPVASYKQA